MILWGIWPVILVAKQFLQGLCKLKLSWDEKIYEMAQTWEKGFAHFVFWTVLVLTALFQQALVSSHLHSCTTFVMLVR